MITRERKVKGKTGPPPGRISSRDLRGNLRIAAAFIVLIVSGGVFGFMKIEGWGFLDSLYMTVLTLSTVGFREVYPLSPAGKIFAIFLIATGVGAVAFTVRTAGRVMLENRFSIVFRRRMVKTIGKLRGQYIICGFGRMGRVICRELNEKGYPFVVVDNAENSADELERLGYLFIRGDATVDEVLVDAGIEKAKGLVTVVTNDTENVFITLTARGLNPKLNIVSRAASDESVQKLIRAGANKVVTPYDLGGFRIAQAVLRPTVLDFLESIVDNKELGGLRLDEVHVPPGSRLDGIKVADAGLRKDLNLMVVAIKSGTGGMAFNPSSGTEIKAGDTLVLLGHGPDLERLESISQKAR